MPAAPTESPQPAVPPWETKVPITRRSLARKLVFWTGVVGLVLLMVYAMQPRAVEVETGLVHQGPLTVYVSEEGKTRIRNRYMVAAPVAGSMQRVDLKPGDVVKAGETVLTRIEPTLSPLLDARARSQAQARVDAAIATRSRANEEIEMSRTGLKYAQANWDRVKNNTDKGTISDTDRDTFEREVEMKSRGVRSAEFALQVADFELVQARAALQQIDKQVFEFSFLALDQWSQHLILRSLRKPQDAVKNVLASLGRDRPAALVAAGDADTREEDTQVVIDFCDRPHRAARIAPTGLLLNRDRRGQPRDRIDFRFLHLAEKLSRVRRQGFDIPSLSFGIKRVKRE